MKKIIAILVTLFFLGALSAAIAEPAASNIGFIDVQKVFKGYKETEKAQEKLQEKEKDFKKDFEKSQEELKKAEKDGKSREEIEKLRKKLETKLSPKREELLKLNEELTVKIQKKIIDSVNKVAKKMGLEVVLDKQVVIVGGMDVSDMVITELNK